MEAARTDTEDNPARNVFSQEVRECSLEVQERQVSNHGSLLIKAASLTLGFIRCIGTIKTGTATLPLRHLLSSIKFGVLKLSLSSLVHLSFFSLSSG